MNNLIDSFEKKLTFTNTDFVRSELHKINWNARLIGIKGGRGVGKTTLLLQYIKLNLKNQISNVLYVSLDHVWFNTNSLLELARKFNQRGGQYLFLDEVHKYNGWAQELKNIYDDFPDLKVVFTGSSLLEILNARADLSRRAVIYQLQGLSFREYLAFETKNEFEPIPNLESLLQNHREIAREVSQNVKVFKYFDDYLRQGYFPFYKEDIELYQIKLGEVINMMLEIELPLLRGLEMAYVGKIKQLLSIIGQSVPFTPNVSKLSNKIGINRNTLLSYFHYLDEIGLTKNLFRQNHGISLLQKPLKVYLDNPNLIFLLAAENSNVGNIRETFFANQVGHKNKLNYIDKGDFLVNAKYVFEIGGKNKTNKQIAEIENAYTVIDDVAIGSHNSIPLWLFGFLY